MKKLSLKNVKRLSIALYILGFLLIIAGSVMGLVIEGSMGTAMCLIGLMAGLLVLVGDIVFVLAFSRCPYCGGFVRWYPNHYCPHCGNFLI